MGVMQVTEHAHSQNSYYRSSTVPASAPTGQQANAQQVLVLGLLCTGSGWSGLASTCKGMLRHELLQLLLLRVTRSGVEVVCAVWVCGTISDDRSSIVVRLLSDTTHTSQAFPATSY